MQVLLINQNATIERLIKLSSGKLGYGLVCANDISDVEAGEYSFIIMDSDLYNSDEFELLKQKFHSSKYILIVSKGVERPEGFDIYVEKPFLPTEMVDILSANASAQASEDETAREEESFSEVFNQTLDDNEPAIEDKVEELELPAVETKELEIEETVDFGDDTTQMESLESSNDELLGLDNSEHEDMQINLDEQLEGLEELADSNSNEPDLIPDGGLESETSELAEDNESNTPESEAELDLGNELELGGMDDLEEDIKANGEVASPHIFDEDEVNKLKNLLDETEEESSEADEFDMENIKIHNDELGSLTEESLAEALGVSIDNTSKDEEIDSADIEEPLAPSLPTTPAGEPKVENLSSNAIQLNPNQSVTLSLDAIRELLNIADVTINITLSKKQ